MTIIQQEKRWKIIKKDGKTQSKKFIEKIDYKQLIISVDISLWKQLATY